MTNSLGKKRWWRRVAVFLLQLAIVLMLVGVIRSAFSWHWKGSDVPAPLAQTLDQHDVAFGQGDALMVQFWATWCGICAMEQSSMAKLAKSERVFSVAMQSGNRDDVLQYLADRDVSYEFTVDAEGALAQSLDIKGVPTTILIGPSGKVRLREAGYTTYWGYRMRLMLLDWFYG